MNKNAPSLFLLLLWILLGYGPATARPDTSNVVAAPESVPAAPGAGNVVASAPRITYTLRMPQPHTHYFEVEMQLTGHAAATGARRTGYVDLKMPVWTPGSYLIREYAKNVEGFRAEAAGQPVRSEKIRKNAWRVYTAAEPLTVRYRVYAYELSVRTSFLDDTHGYLNGASVFLYADALKNNPLQLVIEPYAGWRHVATALPRADAPGTNGPGNVARFQAPNYDLLVDSPIEIGNHRSFSFTAAGVPHTVAMYGEVTYDEKRLAADYQRVCEAATSVIGEHPCTSYLFIVHHTPQGGGGLEHLNSTTLQTSRNVYASESAYKGFLTLVAHEYFHLWNVKRIRPIALGPFDYENENYTRLLWLAEGGTSFYEDHILRRAGFHTPEQYLNVVAGEITGVENQPGNQVQSVAESSFDAWIKYYRPNENSANSTVSYYSKGAVLTGLLNLAILAGSNGNRSLDDVMRLLYNEYYKKQQRGFTDEEFRRAAEQMAGRSLAPFFNDYVNGTASIDYNAFFEPVGLRLTNVAGAGGDGFFGAATATNPTNGRQTVTSVRRGSAAEGAGLNVGDEVLAIDSVRVTDDLSRVLAGRRAGERLRVLINRAGQVRELTARLTENPLVSYRLVPVANPTERQKALYRKWLFIQ